MKCLATSSIAAVALMMAVGLSSCGSDDNGTVQTPKHDKELAQLLVKLELKTRGVIAGHYVNADADHRTWMAEQLLLPAGVADAVFYETVPAATSDRAWVKMVVPEPRNPNNQGDADAMAVMEEIIGGATSAEKATDQAYYYGEPIKTKATCLLCHGELEGDPDPFYPEYQKNGWAEDETVGAVVSRVAPAE